MSARKLIHVSIVSDAICPWCYVGKKRFEIAARQLADKYDFQVEWLPFFLDETLPIEGVDKREHYFRKFGNRFPNMERQMTAVGKEYGINFSYGGKVANTLNSHRLIHLAGLQGKQDQVVNGLFRRYFEEEKNLGSIDVLLEAAEEAGMNRGEVEAYLKSDAGKDEVKKQVDQFRNYVSGVPFFIFEDK